MEEGRARWEPAVIIRRLASTPLPSPQMKTGKGGTNREGEAEGYNSAGTGACTSEPCFCTGESPVGMVSISSNLPGRSKSTGSGEVLGCDKSLGSGETQGSSDLPADWSRCGEVASGQDFTPDIHSWKAGGPHWSSFSSTASSTYTRKMKQEQEGVKTLEMAETACVPGGGTEGVTGGGKSPGVCCY